MAIDWIHCWFSAPDYRPQTALKTAPKTGLEPHWNRSRTGASFEGFCMENRTGTARFRGLKKEKIIIKFCNWIDSDETLPEDWLLILPLFPRLQIGGGWIISIVNDHCFIHRQRKERFRGNGHQLKNSWEECGGKITRIKQVRVKLTDRPMQNFQLPVQNYQFFNSALSVDSVCVPHVQNSIFLQTVWIWALPSNWFTALPSNVLLWNSAMLGVSYTHCAHFQVKIQWYSVSLSSENVFYFLKLKSSYACLLRLRYYVLTDCFTSGVVGLYIACVFPVVNF